MESPVRIPNQTVLSRWWVREGRQQKIADYAKNGPFLRLRDLRGLLFVRTSLAVSRLARGGRMIRFREGVTVNTMDAMLGRAPMERSRPGTMACTGRAYAVRRSLEILGLQQFLLPPVMPVVARKGAVSLLADGQSNKR